MKTEEVMRVYVVDTHINDDESLIINDVPSIPFIASRNPLYIAVKDSQLFRMKKKIDNEKLGGTAIGFWEMGATPTYISKKTGNVNLEAFKQHDVIFFASPDRINEKLRPIYERLVAEVKAAL